MRHLGYFSQISAAMRLNLTDVAYLFFKYPHRKKSHGVNTGERGDHSAFYHRIENEQKGHSSRIL